MSVFLYECSPAFLNVQVRREQLGNRLTLNNGGPLGFQSVSEIVIAASNPEKEKAAWRLLLGEQDASGVYHAGDGPAIRLIRDSRDQIREIVLRVHSLDRARAFLKKNRLLGVGPSREVLLNPSSVQGLKIRLLEQTNAVTP
jgi:hypothetical protein